MPAGITNLALEVMEMIYQHLNITEYHALRATGKRFRALPNIPLLSLQAFKESISFLASKYIPRKQDYHGRILAGWQNPHFRGETCGPYFAAIKKLRLKRIPTQECFDLLAEYCLMDEMLLFFKHTAAVSKIDPNSFNSAAFINASNFDNTELVKILVADSRVDPVAGKNYTFVIVLLF